MKRACLLCFHFPSTPSRVCSVRQRLPPDLYDRRSPRVHVIFSSRKGTPPLCGEASLLGCLKSASVLEPQKRCEYVLTPASTALGPHETTGQVLTSQPHTQAPFLQSVKPIPKNNPEKRSSGGTVFHNSRTGLSCRRIVAAMLLQQCS